MPEVKVLKNFYDRENGLVLRKVGDYFEITQKRATELSELGFVEIAKKSKPKIEKED